MERHTFHIIEITSSDGSLGLFTAIMTGQRRIWVRRLRYRVVLAHGNVPSGEEYYTDHNYTKEERDIEFSEGIWKLFDLSMNSIVGT